MEVIRHNYPDTMQGLMVEFDGLGRTVALAKFREFVDTVRVNVGTGGGWGATDQVLDDQVTHDQRGLVGLERHPQGAVAVWTRRSTSSNYNDDILVSRLSGTWDTPKVFDAPNRYTTPSVATNARARSSSPPGSTTARGNGFDDIHAAIAPSLTGAWGAMTRISPEGTSANSYRDSHAAGGGSAFYVGWGVHGTGNSRTEIVSTKPPGRARYRRRLPRRLPRRRRARPPRPPPSRSPCPRRRRRDHTGAAAPRRTRPRRRRSPTSRRSRRRAKCVKGRKLTLRFKRPPKGYTVKTVTVKVNTKKLATLKGAKLKRPYYLRKLPRGTFTVTVSITLTKGKGLTERRRYTACK